MVNDIKMPGGWGGSWWPWSAKILPQIEQGPLFNSINFSANGDRSGPGGNNGQNFSAEHTPSIGRSSPAYLCPSDDSNKLFTERRWVNVTDLGTATTGPPLNYVVCTGDIRTHDRPLRHLVQRPPRLVFRLQRRVPGHVRRLQQRRRHHHRELHRRHQQHVPRRRELPQLQRPAHLDHRPRHLGRDPHPPELAHEVQGWRGRPVRRLGLQHRLPRQRRPRPSSATATSSTSGASRASTRAGRTSPWPTARSSSSSRRSTLASTTRSARGTRARSSRPMRY